MHDAEQDPEIEFGELRSRRPRVDLRPDQDARYAVEICGTPNSRQLPIFVDLDVMRDMEAHSQTNTDVELGGVLLGLQAEDRDGQPFVHVLDSLRAEHYQATRGSFKFTHETWSDISRRREQMHPDLQMVGWYHTHPGWGIFLSDMDLFICENFFSRPLDVALVIDPRQRTRGWFQWNSQKRTESLAGFYLTTHRHRSRELKHFAQVFSGASMTQFDPRYSEPTSAGQTTVQVIDREGNSQTIGWAMLGLQTFAILLIAMRLFLTPAVSPDPSQSPEKNNQIATETQLADARSEIYRDVLAGMLVRDGSSPDLPKMYADSELEKEQLAAANRSHQVHIDRLEKDLTQQQNSVRSLELDKQTLQTRIDQLSAETTRLKSALQTAGTNAESTDASEKRQGYSPWLVVSLAAIAACAIAVAVWGLASQRRLKRLIAELEDELKLPSSKEQTVSARLKTTA